MPLRKVGKDHVRDPYRPGGEGYTATAQDAAEVLEWFTGERWENPGRVTPDRWTEVSHRSQDGRERVIYQHRLDDSAVEVTYTLFQGGESNHEAHPLPPEQAYAIALDRDEASRGRGQRIFNERHPRPDEP